jgi:hypothetical protein
MYRDRIDSEVPSVGWKTAGRLINKAPAEENKI